LEDYLPADRGAADKISLHTYIFGILLKIGIKVIDQFIIVDAKYTFAFNFTIARLKCFLYQHFW